MRPIYGGIDFGTSNSTVGVIENGRPRLVPLERGEVTLPSAVFFNYEDNGIYLGREAIGLYTRAGYRPIEAFGAYVEAPDAEDSLFFERTLDPR